MKHKEFIRKMRKLNISGKSEEEIWNYEFKQYSQKSKKVRK